MPAVNARLVAAIFLLPLAAVLAVSTAVAGSGGGSVSMARLQGVNFVSRCTFSHRAPDDPIVFPGKPGMSHDHSFVGNTTTNASSTLSSLLAGGTTCERPGDTAAYWMPTLSVDGQEVTPTFAQIYYRRRTIRHVEAFPRGLPHDRRELQGDNTPAAACHVLELRRRRRRGAHEHRADLPCGRRTTPCGCT